MHSRFESKIILNLARETKSPAQRRMRASLAKLFYAMLACKAPSRRWRTWRRIAASIHHMAGLSKLSSVQHPGTFLRNAAWVMEALEPCGGSDPDCCPCSDGLVVTVSRSSECRWCMQSSLLATLHSGVAHLHAADGAVRDQVPDPDRV